MLVYPVTDHYSAGYRSYIANAEGYGLGRRGMEWFWDHYLASSMRAAELAGFPPALVMTAEFDPLRDEGEAYGARLAAWRFRAARTVLPPWIAASLRSSR